MSQHYSQVSQIHLWQHNPHEGRVDELFLSHNHHKDAHTLEILRMIAMTTVCIPFLCIFATLDF